MPEPTRFDWQRWLPGLVTLLHYQRAWLAKDIAAGLVLTTMLVPVGIAYAEASGVPGIYGLYATIIPLLVYALFGPSRILVLGPDSALAAPILAVVVQHAASDPQRAIAIASMMALIAGAFCVIAGLLRLGFITELLSKPIRYGYMNRMQQWEFWLSFTCFVGVAVFGAIPGICIAVAIAVIEFLWDGWRPHHAVLGRVDGTRGYHDVQRYPQARRIPGLVLLRWDAPLFFANAEQFQSTVMAAVDESPTPVQRLIIAVEPVTSIDITSADMLAELDRALEARGVELQFAEMKDPVKDKMRRFELFQHIGETAFHPTVGAAVDAYLEESGIDWQP